MSLETLFPHLASCGYTVTSPVDPIEQALVLLSAVCVICFALSLVALGDVFPPISSAKTQGVAQGGAK